MNIILIFKRLIAFILGIALIALIAGPGDFAQALMFIGDTFIKIVIVLLKL